MTYKFIIITEEYDVFGTNSEKEANDVGIYAIVYNLETLQAIGGALQKTIRQWNDPDQ